MYKLIYLVEINLNKVNIINKKVYFLFIIILLVQYNIYFYRFFIILCYDILKCQI